MSSVGSSQPCLHLRVIYDDDDLIELESHLSVMGWQAVSTAYASASDLAQLAESLSDWSRKPEGACCLDAGRDDGIGFLALRFYVVDRAGHTACHVRLSTSTHTSPLPRPQESWRIAIEMPTELGLVERFAHELKRLATDRRGEAVLQGTLG